MLGLIYHYVNCYQTESTSEWWTKYAEIIDVHICTYMYIHVHIFYMDLYQGVKMETSHCIGYVNKPYDYNDCC